MKSKNRSTTAHSNFWIFFNLALASSILSMAIVFLTLIGIDTTLVILSTSYAHYPALILSAAFIGIVLFLSMALREAVYLRRGIILPSSPFTRTISVAALAAVAFVSIMGLLAIHYRASGKRPSAPEEFGHRAGPFVQPGPFSGKGTYSSDSMVIWYFDPSPCHSRQVLHLGRVPILKNMLIKEEIPEGDGMRHEFHLKGLKPGTLYYYTIPSFDEGIYSFSTGPAEGDADGFRFLCIGDTGNTRTGGEAFSYYGDVIGAADNFYASINEKPSLKIHLGDMVRTGTDLDAWSLFFLGDRQQSAVIPTVTAMGNHEFLDDCGGNFSYFFAQPRYFSFDWGNAHFICIHPFGGPGASADGPFLSVDKDQYRFIKEDLKNIRERKWTIVLTHIPILSTGDYGSNEVLTRQLFKLFGKYRVDLVLAGHDHNLDAFHVDPESSWGGTLYIVCGTGGSRSDSYIMDRGERRWLSWKQDWDTTGPYQHDDLTEKSHLYGELSWGFLDVQVKEKSLTVSYHRWLSYPDFLTVTGQEHDKWDMVPLSESQKRKLGAGRVVFSVSKKKGV